MARRPTFGTPARLKSYLDPDTEEEKRHPKRLSTLRQRRRIVLVSLICGVLAVAASILWRRMSIPGALSSGHARFEQSCETCHGPLQRVPAILARKTAKLDALNSRCMDCHDRFRNDRTHTVDSHMVFHRAEETRARAWAVRYQCTDCHTEHAGRAAPITVAPERLCVECHAALRPAVRSFAGDHPEFAPLVAQQQANPDRTQFQAADAAPLETDLEKVAAAPIEPFRPGRSVGLRFNHARHLDQYFRDHPLYKADRGDQKCYRCHRQDEDGRDLRPSTFESSCSSAGCHGTEEGLLKAETTGPIPIDLRRLSADPNEAELALEPPEGWVSVPMLARLRNIDAAALSPPWLAEARLEFAESEDIVEAQGTFSKRIRHKDPWTLLAVEVLSREAQELARNRGPLRVGNLRARLADQIASLTDPCSEQAAELFPDTGQKGDLCASIRNLDAQVNELDQRLMQMPADPSASPTPGRDPFEGAALWRAGLALEEPHRGRLALAAKRLDEALAGNTFSRAPVVDPRREDRARDELRQQLIALGTLPSEWIQREVHTLQYKLDQLDEPPPAAGPSDAADVPEALRIRRQNLDAQRVQLRSAVVRLAGLGADCEGAFVRLASTVAQTDSAPVIEGSLENWVANQVALREAALRAVVKPCLQCHTLARLADGRVQIVPLDIQDRQLRRAQFLHGPHLRFQAKDFPAAAVDAGSCGACHGDILTSNQAEPIHFTGIESCRTCHNPRDVSDRCQSCHSFHPPMMDMSAAFLGFRVCTAPGS